MGSWFVYILECADGSYYTGITCDLARRVAEHKSGKGARYTRIKKVKGLIWSTESESRSAALKTEMKIKSLSKPEKRLLVLEQVQRGVTLGEKPLLAGLDAENGLAK